MNARLCALVLAAGQGTRVGGPKALLLVDDVPLALAHVRARLADCARVVVVARAPVVDLLSSGAAWFVRSDEDERHGPAGSIRAAVVAGALDDVDRVLITPVDVAPASSATVATLLAALTAGAAAASFVHGHPIAIDASIVRARYRTAAAPPILRDVLADLGAACARLPAPFALPRPLDRVEDVERATGAPPRFHSGPSPHGDTTR